MTRSIIVFLPVQQSGRLILYFFYKCERKTCFLEKERKKKSEKVFHECTIQVWRQSRLFLSSHVRKRMLNSDLGRWARACVCSSPPEGRHPKPGGCWNSKWNNRTRVVIAEHAGRLPTWSSKPSFPGCKSCNQGLELRVEGRILLGGELRTFTYMSNLNPQGVGIIGPTSQMRKLKLWSLIIQVWWSLGHGWETPGLGTAGSCSRFPHQTWFRAEPSSCPWTDRSSRFTDEETEMWRLECLFRITQEVQNRDKFGIQLS